MFMYFNNIYGQRVAIVASHVAAIEPVSASRKRKYRSLRGKPVARIILGAWEHIVRCTPAEARRRVREACDQHLIATAKKHASVVLTAQDEHNAARMQEAKRNAGRLGATLADMFPRPSKPRRTRKPQRA